MRLNAGSMRKTRARIFSRLQGRFTLLYPRQGPGIRVDTYLKSGDEISIHYDPMIAKIIVYDRTRDAAITRMQYALNQTVVLGVTTNIDFLQTLLAHTIFSDGQIDTGFVDTHLAELTPAAIQVDDLTLLAAALTDLHPVPTAQSVSSATEGDLYNPWARADHFRLHTRS